MFFFPADLETLPHDELPCQRHVLCLCVVRVEKAIAVHRGLLRPRSISPTSAPRSGFSGLPDVGAVVAAIGKAGYETAFENSGVSITTN